MSADRLRQVGPGTVWQGREKQVDSGDDSLCTARSADVDASHGGGEDLALLSSSEEAPLREGTCNQRSHLVDVGDLGR